MAEPALLSVGNAGNAGLQPRPLWRAIQRHGWLAALVALCAAAWMAMARWPGDAALLMAAFAPATLSPPAPGPLLVQARERGVLRVGVREYPRPSPPGDPLPPEPDSYDAGLARHIAEQLGVTVQLVGLPTRAGGCGHGGRPGGPGADRQPCRSATRRCVPARHGAICDRAGPHRGAAQKPADPHGATERTDHLRSAGQPLRRAAARAPGCTPRALPLGSACRQRLHGRRMRRTGRRRRPAAAAAGADRMALLPPAERHPGTSGLGAGAAGTGRPRIGPGTSMRCCSNGAPRGSKPRPGCTAPAPSCSKWPCCRTAPSATDAAVALKPPFFSFFRFPFSPCLLT